MTTRNTQPITCISCRQPLTVTVVGWSIQRTGRADGWHLEGKCSCGYEYKAPTDFPFYLI